MRKLPEGHMGRWRATVSVCPFGVVHLAELVLYITTEELKSQTFFCDIIKKYINDGYYVKVETCENLCSSLEDVIDEALLAFHFEMTENGCVQNLRFFQKEVGRSADKMSMDIAASVWSPNSP
jgi:hypothetical protein